MREPTYQELVILNAFMTHSRTSCHKAGNEYFNEQGYPRCEKCAVEYRIHHGEWPHGATVKNWRVNLDLSLDSQ